jgi:acyl-coenzyme A synthetase/AMP-(fatty) acid ligase
VVLHPGATLTPEALRAWTTERLAPYKIPRQVRFVDELPRNAMGKVVKPEVKRLLSLP